MKERFVAAALLVSSAAYVAGARHFEAGFIADPVGPSAFPFGIGALLVLASIALFFDGGGGDLPKLSWRHGALLVTLAAYVLLLDLLGFVVATTVLAGFIAWLFDGPTKRAIVMSFLLSLLIFVLFAYGLSIPLPRGF